MMREHGIDNNSSDCFELNVFSHGESETAELGARLGQYMRKRDIVALDGPLGSGKSVFARGLIQGICGLEVVVPSPTFTIIQIYDAPNFQIWHCDFYRLVDSEQIFELGLDEAFSNAVTVIEWPDRVGNFLADRRLLVKFLEEGGDEGHTVRLGGDSSWANRLKGITN